MATVEEVAREVVASIDTTAGYLLASRWVSNRYRQLCSRSRFRHLRKLGEVILPAPIDSGTATATNGSRTVTGDATAQTAWTPSVVGRYFRTRTAWYKIVAVVGGALRLDTTFAEDTTSSASYTIIERRVRLPKDVRWLGETFVHYRLRRPLDRLSLIEMDYRHPERQLVGTPPCYWADAGVDVDTDGHQVRVVEFYPISDQDELLAFVYWSIPPELALTDEIPTTIDPYVLKEGALIDAMRYEMGRALNAVQLDVAAHWRNEYRAQSTAWERNIIEAIRTDRGADDVTFILESARGGPYATDIVNARDQIFSQGNRP